MSTSEQHRTRNRYLLVKGVSAALYYGSTFALSYFVPLFTYLGLKSIGHFRPFLDYNRFYHVSHPTLEISGDLWQPILLLVAIPSFVCAHLFAFVLSLPIIWIIEKFKEPTDGDLASIRFFGALLFFYLLSSAIIWSSTDYTWGKAFAIPSFVVLVGFAFLFSGAKSK